jgi:hypothetical protein
VNQCFRQNGLDHKAALGGVNGILAIISFLTYLGHDFSIRIPYFISEFLTEWNKENFLIS